MLQSIATCVSARGLVFRYNRVLEATALRPDIAMLPFGDMTEIGEVPAYAVHTRAVCVALCSAASHSQADRRLASASPGRCTAAMPLTSICSVTLCGSVQFQMSDDPTAMFC